ncbi:MAG: LacI family DNA-binding transcriptional regulator, partial [Phycisphaerae bacterium]
AAYQRPTFAKRARKIRLLAEEMGYRPNASARAIRQGSFGAVTLMMSADPGRSELPKKMFYGLQAAASEADLAVNLNIIPDDQLTDETFVPKALREWHSDGLLINYHKSPPAHLQDLIDAYSIPSVFLNLDVDHNSVRPDDRGAGRTATEHLMAMGHRRIWYVGYSYRHDKFHYSELERRDGYADAMLDAGLEPTCIDSYHLELGVTDPRVYTRGLTDSRMSGWPAALTSPQGPTAVVCYGPDVDVSVVHHAAARAGLAVPRDLSIVTFGGSPAFDALGIDTWLVPEYDVGFAGLQMLGQRIGEPRKTCPARKLPFRLERGESVAPPRF